MAEDSDLEKMEQPSQQRQGAGRPFTGADHVYPVDGWCRPVVDGLCHYTKIDEGVARQFYPRQGTDLRYRAPAVAIAYPCN